MPGLIQFQAEGATFLSARRRALLGDEPRVGKTPQAIVAGELTGARSRLVLCPAVARENWLAEYKRFAGIEGDAIRNKKDLVHPDLTVCSYDIVADKHIYPKIARPFDVVILDEAHYLARLSSNRTKAAFGIANGAQHAWALTGTPAPKDHGDLYPLLQSFGIVQYDYWTFVKEFCEISHTKFGDAIVGSKNAHKLALLLEGFMLRRLLRDVAPQMPKARWTTICLQPGEIPESSMTKEQLAAATAEEKQLATRLDEARELLVSLDEDAAKNFRRLMGLRLVEPVIELINAELHGNESKIVVFGWHRDVLVSLHKALQKFDSRLILGSTDNEYKEQAKLDFRTKPECRVVIANIIAAGTAIDLSTADSTLFIEEDWTPGNNLQAAMRVVSQFKDRPVLIRSAVVRGSVQSRIQSVLARRTRGMSSIFAQTVAIDA